MCVAWHGMEVGGRRPHLKVQGERETEAGCCENASRERSVPRNGHKLYTHKHTRSTRKHTRRQKHIRNINDLCGVIDFRTERQNMRRRRRRPKVRANNPMHVQTILIYPCLRVGHVRCTSFHAEKRLRLMLYIHPY